MKAIAVLLSVVCLIAIGVVAVNNLAGTEESSAGLAGFTPASEGNEGLHPGSAGGASASASRKSVPRVIYWNSKYYKLGPQGVTSFWMQCPKGTKAIEGYFYSNRPGVVLGSSFPAKRAKVNASRKPRWNFGLLNLNTSATARYYTGVVCMRGIRG
jgi:hypothetical protein